MSLVPERLGSDLRELRMLAARSGGRIRLLTPGPSQKLVDRVGLELVLKTAVDNRYPAHAVERVGITITLPSRYPLAAPRVDVKPVIFHPHVFSSGQFCANRLWTNGCSLVTFIERIIKIVIFDPEMMDFSSPANAAAVTWYKSALARYPTAFPTTDMPFERLRRPLKVVWHES